VLTPDTHLVKEWFQPLLVAKCRVQERYNAIERYVEVSAVRYEPTRIVASHKSLPLLRVGDRKDLAVVQSLEVVRQTGIDPAAKLEQQLLDQSDGRDDVVVCDQLIDEISDAGIMQAENILEERLNRCVDVCDRTDLAQAWRSLPDTGLQMHSFGAFR
jgi:hypothetical protein